MNQKTGVRNSLQSAREKQSAFGRNLSRRISLLTIPVIVSLGAITSISSCAWNNDGLAENPALHDRNSEPVPLQLVSLSLSGIDIQEFDGEKSHYSATADEDLETTEVTAEANCDVGVGIEDQNGSIFQDNWSQSETVISLDGGSWIHSDGYYPCEGTRLLSRNVRLIPGTNKITVRVAVTFGGTRTEREYATSEKNYTITITRKRPLVFEKPK